MAIDLLAPQDDLLKRIDNEQDALTKFLGEHAVLTDADRVTLKGHSDTLKALRDVATEKMALSALRTKLDPSEPVTGNPAAKTLGAQVTDAETYTRAVGAVGALDPIRNGSVKVAGLLPASKAAIVNTATATQGAELLTVDKRLLEAITFPRSILDLVGRGSSDSDSIEWTIPAFTNNAAEVGEATSDTGGTGAKPISTNSWSVRSAGSVTIAHLKKITDKALRNRAQLRTMIEGELRNGLLDRIDTQLANGPGTGVTMRGMLAVSGTQAQAYVTSLLITAIKARTKLRRVGFTGTPTILLSPEDEEALLITAINLGAAQSLGVFLDGIGRMSLVGMPIVSSPNIAEGTAIIGNFATATLYDVGGGERIAWTDSDQADFGRNIYTCRAEVDVIFAVERPEQLVVTTTHA